MQESQVYKFPDNLSSSFRLCLLYKKTIDVIPYTELLNVLQCILKSYSLILCVAF